MEKRRNLRGEKASVTIVPLDATWLIALGFGPFAKYWDRENFPTRHSISHQDRRNHVNFTVRWQ
jgi:hypothetical protein